MQSFLTNRHQSFCATSSSTSKKPLISEITFRSENTKDMRERKSNKSFTVPLKISRTGTLLFLYLNENRKLLVQLRVLTSHLPPFYSFTLFPLGKVESKRIKLDTRSHRQNKKWHIQCEAGIKMPKQRPPYSSIFGGSPSLVFPQQCVKKSAPFS